MYALGWYCVFSHLRWSTACLEFGHKQQQQQQPEVECRIWLGSDRPHRQCTGRHDVCDCQRDSHVVTGGVLWQLWSLVALNLSVLYSCVAARVLWICSAAGQNSGNSETTNHSIWGLGGSGYVWRCVLLAFYATNFTQYPSLIYYSLASLFIIACAQTLIIHIIGVELKPQFQSMPQGGALALYVNNDRYNQRQSSVYSWWCTTDAWRQVHRHVRLMLAHTRRNNDIILSYNT